MIRLIKGESVVVARPQVVYDALGESDTTTTERTTVDDVIVTPGATSDMAASRPEGIHVSFSLGFPKRYQKPLRGCFVEVRGQLYKVVGDPQPYSAQNVPGAHNYTVEVTRSDG